MTINDRIKYFRKEIKGINQKEFAKVLGVTQSGVSYMEQKGSTVADSSIKAICSVFNVNEEWLRSGAGDMFLELPEEDEEAAYVSELLEDSDNDLYKLIKEIMHTYHELSPKSKEVIRDFSAKLRENIKKGS